MKIYVLHGTNEQGFKGIGDGDHSRGGYVGGGAKGFDGKGWFQLSTTGSHSWLGKGIYATTSYHKAAWYGPYVYLLEFEVKKLKMVNKWDCKNSWRKDKSVDGVFIPPRMDAKQAYPDNEDEFCLRGRCLKTVWLVTYPGNVQVSNLHFLKKNHLGDILKVVAKKTTKWPRILDVKKTLA